MRTKKIAKLILAAFMVVFMSMFLFGCFRNNKETPSNTPLPTPQNIDAVEVATPAPTPIDETVYIESNLLPDFWQGEWVCVYAEYYFREDEVIFVKDFDNAVLYTTLAGGSPLEVNRWFAYDEAEQLIHIFNEPPPYPEQNIRITFEIKKASEDEIVMTRQLVGQEVRFERVSGE